MDTIDTLKSLHTALIDSREGYKEALKDADPKGMTALFREMIALRTEQSAGVEQILSGRGELVDESGSFMSTVHRTVISIRSLFSDLDESILPGLIDGEERIVSYYDEAIADTGLAPHERTELSGQRSELVEKISDMRLRSAKAA